MVAPRVEVTEGSGRPASPWALVLPEADTAGAGEGGAGVFFLTFSVSTGSTGGETEARSQALLFVAS